MTRILLTMLLLAAMLATTPSALAGPLSPTCASIDPGPFSGGVLGETSWYAKSNARSGCVAASAEIDGPPSQFPVYQFGSDAWDNSCVYLTGNVGCI